MRRFLFFLFLSASFIGFTQSKKDSLENWLKEHPEVTPEHIDALNQLTLHLLISNPAAGVQKANSACNLADSLGYEKGIFRASINKGAALWTVGLVDQSLEHYLSALAMQPETPSTDHLALFNNIGEVFKSKLQFDSSKMYFEMAMRYRQEHFPDLHHSILYANIGELYAAFDKIDSAEMYFKLGYENGILSSNQRGQAYSLSGLADLEAREGRMLESISQHQNALNIRQQINDKRGVLLSYLRIGELFLNLSNFDSSIHYLDKAENLSNQIASKDLLSRAYQLKSKAYLDFKFYQDAFSYQEKHVSLKDSLANEGFLSRLANIKEALLVELKDAENQKLLAENEADKKSRRLELIFVIAAVLIFALGVLLIYQIRMRKLHRANTYGNQKIIDAVQKAFAIELSKGFDHYVDNLLKVASEALNIERAIFSFNDEDKQHLIAANVCSQRAEDQEIVGQIAEHGRFKKYFEHLERDKVLAIENVNTDPGTAEFDPEYLKKYRVKSLLDAEVRLGDRLIGALSFEETTTLRSWTSSDRRFATTMSALLALAYSIIQNNELITELRSKNKKLRKSAYMVSHNLREPLSQILGFSQLAQVDEKLSLNETISFIEKASNEIDGVIRKVADELGQEPPN